MLYYFDINITCNKGAWGTVWIVLTKNGDRWRVLVIAVMNFQVP
jgi:hypothetical protein